MFANSGWEHKCSKSIGASGELIVCRYKYTHTPYIDYNLKAKNTRSGRLYVFYFTKEKRRFRSVQWLVWATLVTGASLEILTLSTWHQNQSSWRLTVAPFPLLAIFISALKQDRGSPCSTSAGPMCRGDKLFTALYVSGNDLKSITSIDFWITNTF